MSQQNIDVARRGLDAYTRRDVAALRMLTEPDIELDWPASRRWLADVSSGFDEALRFHADYFEAGEGRGAQGGGAGG